MIVPEINQYVKIVLKNSLIIEGVIKAWEKKQACIQSLETGDLTIINNIKENIILVKICYKENNQFIEESENIAPIQQRVSSNRSEDIVSAEEALMAEKEHLEQELKKLPTNISEKNQTLANLRLSIKEIDQKIIKNKLKSHTPTEVKSNYAYPNFFTNGSSK